MKYDIVTIGDAFEDVFVRPDLEARNTRGVGTAKAVNFELGAKVPLKTVQYEIGGSACNAAVGLSRMGYKSSLITLLGEDTPKDKVLQKLFVEGVDYDHVMIGKGLKTGFSVIFMIEDNRTIFVYHGIKNYADLTIKKSVRAKWFFVTPLGENPNEIMKRMVAEVAENGAKLAWNPGSRQIAEGANHHHGMLSACSILFLNKEEGIKFVNLPVKPSIEQLARKLYSFGPRIVVITDGKNGAYAYDGSELYFRKADLRLVPVDVTGAGDSYASGFLGRMMEFDWSQDKIDGRVIEEALQWGHKNAASVIHYIGAQEGLLGKKAILD